MKLSIKKILKEISLKHHEDEEVNSIQKSKIDFLEKLRNKIHPEQRIHISANPINSIKDVKKEKLDEDDLKPPGIWYGFGGSWIDYVLDYYPLAARPYVYFVQINEDRVISLNSDEDFQELSKKYPKKGSPWNNRDYFRRPIDFKSLFKDYDGFEARGLAASYNDLDVSSGVVWRNRSIRLIPVFGRRD